MGKNPAKKEAAKATTAKATPKARVEKKKAPAKKVIEASAPKIAKQCRIEKCKRTYRAKGYCGTHYTLWRQGTYGRARYKHCKQVDCKHAMALNRHGYCENHYQALYVRGEQQAPSPQAEAPKTKEAKAS